MTERERRAIERAVSAPAFYNRRALEEIDARRIRMMFHEVLRYAQNRSTDPFWSELAERLLEAIKRMERLEGGE